VEVIVFKGLKKRSRADTTTNRSSDRREPLTHFTKR
jgi:hypothetical protein